MSKLSVTPRAAVGLAFLAGALGACGFAPLGAVWLLAASLVALLALLHGRGWCAGAAIGFAYGLGQFTLGLNWIATAFTFQSAMPAWLGWLGVVLVAAYVALYPALAAAIAVRLAAGSPTRLALGLAGAWTLAEWLRSVMFTGFPWNALGVALVDWGQAARWIGVYGLSALLLLAAGGLWLAARRALRPAAALLGLAAAGLASGLVVTPALPRETLTATVVQPNNPQSLKYDPASDLANFRRLAAPSARPAGLSGPRLLLWPEAAILDYLRDGYPSIYYRRAPADVRAALGARLSPDDLLLLGTVDLVLDRRGEAAAAVNGVTTVTPDGALGPAYAKAHLLPFGEYLPWRPILSRIGLQRLVPGSLDFRAGPGPRTLDLGRHGRVGVQICYEIIFAGRVVDRADRPQLLFNPSNDAWFGAWGPPQHLAHARLRALEEGLPVLRSTPTGISAIIDPVTGREIASIPAGRAGAATARVPAARALGLYARLGNAVPLILAALLLGSAIATFPRRLRSFGRPTIG